MSMQMFILVVALAVGFFGLWGNANIIIATFRRKEFQTKCGILIAILACGDTVCIVYVWHNAIRSILPEPTYRSACFWTITPYIFALNFQSILMLMLSVDRLFAICMPIKYRLFSTQKYIFVCAVPAAFSGLLSILMSAAVMVDEQIKVCNPSFALPEMVNTFNNRLGLGSSLITLCFYVVSIALLHIKRKAMRRRSERGVEYSHLVQQYKVMRTIALVIFVFLCSWFYAHLSVFIAMTFKINSGFLDFAMQTVTVPAIICYSTNYYIYLWRSRDYRRAFVEQITFLYKCRNTSKVSVFRTTEQNGSSVTYVAPAVPESTPVVGIRSWFTSYPSTVEMSLVHWSLTAAQAFYIQRCLCFYLILAFTVGLFSNGLIVVVTLKSRSLRNPCNILIAIQAVMDILTAFQHPLFLYFIFTETLIPFSECYKYQFFPCSAMNITTALMVAVGLDRYLSIKHPIRYRKWSRTLYLSVMMFACILYDILVKAIGYITLSNDPVICLISDAYYGIGKDFWVFSQVVINVFVLIVYQKIRKEMKKMSMTAMKTHTDNIMASLYIIVFFYIFGWLTTMCLVGTLRVLTTETNLVVTAELASGIFANLNMTMPAFVYFSRSMAYKNALKRLWRRNRVGTGAISMVTSNQNGSSSRN
ncbi:hypothetical protein QR680_015010 [Steinernema hermaphroditum]|uniref:G-protein coupled receptors family 1 profile domain-containing protein n=1 Tax=Steinernema hermaphroditum TaxID=289476 RepID=A0AA39M4Z9_9BILA|nr:hypothetical protein QR680_015010 [Steinernema hermaphroditum]